MSHPALANGNPFFMLLDKTPMRDLVDPKRSLITLLDNTTILDALNLLTTSHISSCPVLDHKTNQCIGGVDFLSLLKYITKLRTSRDNRDNTVNEDLYDDKATLINKDSIDLTNITIKNVIPHCSTLSPCFVETPVSHCLHSHRYILYKKDYELLTTVSQSDIIKHISKIITDARAGSSYTRRYASDIIKLCDTKLNDLNLFHQPVSLNQNATIYDAIEICTQRNFRVVSILNDNGQIIGDFPVTKLSSLHSYYTQIKTLTLHDWVTTINPTNNKDVPCIDHNGTFEQALLLMLSLKRHHLWTVDEHKHPTSIVTITDLFRILQLASPSPGANNTGTAATDGDDDVVPISKLWK